MGCTKIDVGAIVGLGDKIQGSKNTVSDVHDSVNAIRGQIDGRILGRNNMSERLSSATSQLMNIEARIGKVKITTENGANQYQQTERTVMSWKNEMIGNINSISQDYSTNSSAIIGDVSVTGTETEKSWFAKFLNNELKTSDSVLRGEKAGQTEVWGVNTDGKMSGDILAYEAGVESKMSWSLKDENGNWNTDMVGFATEAKATGAIAQGELEGKFGYLHGKLSGKAITGAVSGEARATIWEDGKFQPGINLGAKAEASVLEGEAELGVGTDQYGVYAKAEGDVLHAEANAEAGVGCLGTDDSGKTVYGAKAEASALASVAHGEVKGGFTICGIDIDIGVEGYAVAAGVEAGGSITTEGVKASFGGALGLGGGVDISVDWSDAKWIGESVDAVGGFIGEATDFVGDVANDFVAVATSTWEDAGDFLVGWIN